MMETSNKDITEVLSMDEINNLNIICAATGRRLTDEQMIFASDFTKPTISFSDAGTGKTYAVAVGLVHTQTYHKVQGNKICVMSFTRESAREISSRYDLMSSYKMLSSRANFSTFHSLCYSIVNEAYGRPDIHEFDYNSDLAALRNYVEQEGIGDASDMWLKRLVYAMNSLNSSFIFDPEEMKVTLKFRQLDMDPITFNKIRKQWFIRQVGLKSMPQGDLPLHCYNLLMHNDRIRAKYRHMFDILVIDEFQDMSILYIKIIKELCKTPIVIGDMKQQIYAFNGASDAIQREFFDSYPDARVCPLTQSFRCKDEIVSYAMNLISRNKSASYGFKGIGKGGMVDVLRNREISIDTIADEIYDYQKNVETKGNKDIMFLFRNNFSGMVIMETLYQHGVRFRTSKFKRVMDLPIFKELCTLLEAIDDDKDVEKVWEALKLFDEFKYQRMSNCPIIQIITKYDRGWLEIEYKYRDPSMLSMIEILKICREGMRSGKTAGQLFSTMLPIYENLIIHGRWYMLEFPKEFYFNLVAPIANNKTYDQLRADETEKMMLNREAMDHFDGVRCYTIHSAKGLEADEVYVIDCDQGVIPSDKNLKTYVDQRCTYEAARMIRNERNLLYVAVTRAKTKVHICYTSELAHLIANPDNNEYCYLDEIYENTPHEYYNSYYYEALYNYRKEQ